MNTRSRLALTMGLFTSLIATFVAAGVGAVASINAAAFYAQLARPAWAPPATVFGPVWSVLYALMAIAAWLVWRQEAAQRKVALALFVVQLIVNALWSWLFFAWRVGGWAMLDVLVLVALIAATIVAFQRVSRWAAALMLPYLAWVCFASALTWSVWRANPALLG